MSKLKKLLGQRIKELRSNKGLTQEKLAELTNIGPTSISKIETGNSRPTDENLIKIAEALGVEAYKLYQFNHHRPLEEIKLDLHKIVDNAQEEQLRLIYKIISNIIE